MILHLILFHVWQLAELNRLFKEDVLLLAGCEGKIHQQKGHMLGVRLAWTQGQGGITSEIFRYLTFCGCWFIIVQPLHIFL